MAATFLISKDKGAAWLSCWSCCVWYSVTCKVMLEHYFAMTTCYSNEIKARYGITAQAFKQTEGLNILEATVTLRFLFSKKTIFFILNIIVPFVSITRYWTWSFILVELNPSGLDYSVYLSWVFMFLPTLMLLQPFPHLLIKSGFCWCLSPVLLLILTPIRTN